jgi:hypothetical protein
MQRIALNIDVELLKQLHEAARQRGVTIEELSLQVLRRYLSANDHLATVPDRAAPIELWQRDPVYDSM